MINYYININTSLYVLKYIKIISNYYKSFIKLSLLNYYYYLIFMAN